MELSLHLKEDGKKMDIGRLRDFQWMENNSLEAVEVISTVLHFMNDKVYGNVENAISLQIALLTNK